MTRAPLDREEFGRWRDEADRALAAARLNIGGGLHNWACFLAEQSAQLAMKGLLHGVGKAPWGHDLVRFGALASEAGFDMPDAVGAALRRLGRHYIPARYPDAHPAGPPGPHYGANDAEEALVDAASIIEFVDTSWRELDG